MPDHNPWIVAAIIAGVFIIWLVADFFIAWLIGNFIHVGNPSEEETEE